MLGLTSFSQRRFGSNDIPPGFSTQVKKIAPFLDSVGTEGEVKNLLSEFRQLTGKYPTEWRGYYWQAYCHLKLAEFKFEQEAKDQALDSANWYIYRTEMFIKNNPEVHILKSWYLYEKISIDAETRMSRYLPDLEFFMREAYNADQSNPRYFFLKGRYMLNDTTRTAKKESLRYFQTAELLYQQEEDKNAADPKWGRAETALVLGKYLPPPPQSVAEARSKGKDEPQPGDLIPDAELPDSMKGAILPQTLFTQDELDDKSNRKKKKRNKAKATKKAEKEALKAQEQRVREVKPGVFDRSQPKGPDPDLMKVESSSKSKKEKKGLFGFGKKKD